MLTQLRHTIAIAALMGFASTAGAAETFESLARRIPGEANALVLIDVEQVLAAPLAQSQGWARKLEAAYVERPVVLPPEATKLVLGAVLVPSDDFLAAWEVGVMELSEPIGVRAIARSEGGYVDEINGQSAAVTPHDAAFVDLVYRNVLARPPDPAGRAHWAGGLDSGRLTRGGVMIGFSESAEFVRKTGTTPPPSPPTTPPGPTTPTTSPPTGCSTADVYEARNGACVASYEDASGDVDCGQLPAAAKPVKLRDRSNDPYRLDSDSDGVGCETR